MNSEMAQEINNPEEEICNIENEAYEPSFVQPEVVSYDDAFPCLQRSDSPAASPIDAGQWNKKLSLRSSTTTQVFHVPLEERRYREMNERQFGGDQEQQARICQDIMTKTGVSIEMSLAKDESLTVVITGKADSVVKARRLVTQQLQTQANDAIRIPKEHHRFILGKNGKKRQELENNTATKIMIPRQDEKDDVIKITGTKDGIEKARHEIQLISEEQSKLAFERLPIPKIYHTFIVGPNNQNLKDLQEMTGAKINVPPPSLNKDEIAVSGEKEGVHSAIQQIMAIYEEKRRKCQPVSVEVRKSQHKYVIGPRGSNLAEILLATDVSVEVPPLDSSSDTITLRGEPDKLGPALTMVYAKANSVIIAEIDAPSWLHRFIIGRKGITVKQITQDLPKVHIEFTDGEDKIVIEGPPGEVEQAREELEKKVKDLTSRMDFVEIKIDPKYHRHIIGRQGANITRIKNETGVSIRIPADGDTSPIIRIEGDPKGVQTAKKELLDMAQKMENERVRDILIEQRFHKTIIGAKGQSIRDIREMFNEAQISVPDPAKKSDVVQIRGPKEDVDKCYKYLQKLHQELKENNYQASVHIFKQFHKNIIGKGGATIRKIRDETDTKIDLPSENSDSDVIVITGKKANVEIAKNRIELIQKELANIKEVTIEIPHKHHNAIIGAKGRLIRAIMEECGGVIIRFPPEGAKNDKVTIRGPKDDVENARKQLLQQTSEREKTGFTAEIRAKPNYHKFLIGKGGANIKKVRDRTGARIIFPSSKDADQEIIYIIGEEDSVKSAKTELETLISDLENIVEDDMNVDPRHHRHFVARRGEVLRQIAEEYGGVTVSFPRSGVKSDRVVLKGSKECVASAKKRIQEIVDDLDSMVTIELIIPQKYHRTVMGAKGYKVQEITRDHEVGIKFPDRPVNGDVPKENGTSEPENGSDELVNGDAASESSDDTKPRACDIITISGKPENCQGAKEALLALVPVTEEFNVPYEFHRFIIGQKGRDVRKMMDDFDVNLSIPPPSAQSDTITIIGPPANVEDAKRALQDKMDQLNLEKEDRELKSFKLEIHVDPKHHPKIIGRKGAVISKIRMDHDVNIQFPERKEENEDLITIVGYEKNASAAKADILEIVRELESKTSIEVELDRRVHSRIIGGRGRAIKKVMEDYKVDIRFPRGTDTNPDLVTITGSEDNVYDCRDHLLNLEEEYMQDVRDQENLEQYMVPSRDDSRQDNGQKSSGYICTGAPWDQQPDTNSTEDFPSLSAVATTNNSTSTPRMNFAWGPVRR
ncbi:vigilin-like [Tubulanus polymorphus]|uniref:vigilin-like n=1 Tax=Tubulanus polymorphus TaxID=672921 RepID=UPI003DA24B6D